MLEDTQHPSLTPIRAWAHTLHILAHAYTHPTPRHTHIYNRGRKGNNFYNANRWVKGIVVNVLTWCVPPGRLWEAKAVLDRSHPAFPGKRHSADELLLFIPVAKYLGVKCCNFRACTDRLNPGKLTPPTAGTQGSQEVLT